MWNDSSAASPPVPLSAGCSRSREGPWRRGGGRYGAWGPLCGPRPPLVSPLPLRHSAALNGQPKQGEPLAEPALSLPKGSGWMQGKRWG